MAITRQTARPQEEEEEEEADRRHRKALHPADLHIEAWGPTREECIAEAARGMVGSFAVVAARPPCAGPSGT